MINIIGLSGESFESQFVPIVESAYAESSRYLDQLPEDIDIKFTDNGASDITGVGGFTVSRAQINLAVSEDFSDHVVQRENLRSVVFHESFHVQQKFTFEDSPFTALESAVYEGCAIAYERQYAKNPAAYADYSLHDEAELAKWLDEIRSIGTAYFEDAATWRKWAFYHPDYDQKWIIYKVGSWLVDRILHDNNLGVLNLKNKSADEIAGLSRFLA